MSTPGRVSSPSHNPRFEEVQSFQHPDGPMILITKKHGDAKHSFCILKTYDGGKRTGYLNRRHIKAIRELLDQAEEWLDTEVEKYAASKQAAAR